MQKRKQSLPMKDSIFRAVKVALSKCGFPSIDFFIERSQQGKHGHFATNVALVLTKQLKRNPLEIAREITKNFGKIEGIEKIEIAPPGFINFTLSEAILQNEIHVIQQLGNEYGKLSTGDGKTCQVEFVSANPTGPLTVGHGRGAALGDTIARIMEWNGYSVEREYYFNNAGKQMRILGASVYYRYLQQIGKDVEFPDECYQGDYIREIASKIADQNGRKFEDQPENKIFQDTAENKVFETIKISLRRIGIFHDSFFNENELYEKGKIDDALYGLKKSGYLYEKDGAIWFKATEFGAEKDRVIVRSNGEPTYRLPDIAYHIEKINRNYDVIIDVFGADHSATYPDVLAGLQSLNLSTEHIRVAIHQFVTFTRDGQKVKMSTRKAQFVTLDDLVDLVGSDAVRYFFLMRAMNSHLNFDLALATKQSDENPVFYLQYAHARISNIFLHAEAKNVPFNPECNLSHLTHAEELDLIFILSEFPEIIALCKRTLEPQSLCNYLNKLAAAFHKFYTECKVITDNIPLSQARLLLCAATKQVLSNGLTILGISKPERM